MDLSNSMIDDRENIVKLGGQLAQTIENITKNYKIGWEETDWQIGRLLQYFAS